MNFSDARVVVVGDAMIDRYIHGRVERVSPEAPVPVFVEERREDRPGGAANVVENLRALGCKVLHPFATKSALKTRFMVNNQQIFRHDEEDCSAIDEATQNRSFQFATQQPCDVMILSDYAKGALPTTLCQALIAWAKANDITTIVDPKGDDWRKYNNCDVITPNAKEMANVRYANGPHSLGTVMTCGSSGMVVTFNGGRQIRIRATNTGPVDVTGAGDTVVAVLSAAIAVGFDLERAAELANIAAGIVVGKFGTATCSLEELEAAWQS